MRVQFYGFFYALAAFTMWGALPAYWKQMEQILPLEILCHRVIWSCVFLCLVITCQRRWTEVFQVLSDRVQLSRLIASGLLIGFNWFIYIWAVNTGHVVETSLGYYICPLVSVVLGFFLLGERFTRFQSIALGFMVLGIAYSLLAFDGLPAFGLTLALSFGFYGYAHKRISIRPVPGLLIETIVLVLPALGFVIYQAGTGASPFLRQLEPSLWLMGAGIATSLPLLCFAAAASRLKLSTLGLFQYLAPSIAFFLGVFVYREPFDFHSLITFVLIWIGVVAYSSESVRNAKRRSGLEQAL